MYIILYNIENVNITINPSLRRDINTVRGRDINDVVNIVNLDTLGVDVTRHTLDLSINNYGNRLLQMCQSLDLLITNGRLGKDQGVGDLTCKNTTVLITVFYRLNRLLMYLNLKFYHLTQ
jgi:hypothetical protein